MTGEVYVINIGGGVLLLGRATIIRLQERLQDVELLPDPIAGALKIELDSDAVRQFLLTHPPEVIQPTNPVRTWQRANDWRNKRRKFGA